MAQRSVLSIDATSVSLLWAPVVVLCAGVVLGWPGPWLLSITGLAAGVCTWVYAVWIARPRRQWLDDLEEVADELWRASGADRQPMDTGLNRAARVTQSLRGVRGPVVARLGDALADLSRLRAVFDATPGPTLATDRAGVVVACNRAVESVTARRPAEVLGRPLEQLFTQAEVIRLHAGALGGEAGVAEVNLVRDGAPRIFQVLCAPVRLGQGAGGPANGVVVAMRDVTDLARAVHLKTDFVANASHELRTPLSTIRLSVETLEDGAWEDGPMRARLTQVIRSNVQRLQELVEDLLDLSRLESPDVPVSREQFPFAGIADTLVGDFQQVCAERHLTLQFAVEPGAAQLHTDRRLLTLILKNLVDNATKFAYEGTAVRVEAERTGAGVRFRVVDQGLGIPLDQQARIFERFYQVDPSRTGMSSRRGTGLGLAIVKHAVKGLGGSVRVESVWKQGTTMIVEVPAA
ncbi:MAG: ATP-binding protein [Phycisphaerales bacterium]